MKVREVCICAENKLLLAQLLCVSLFFWQRWAQDLIIVPWALHLHIRVPALEQQEEFSDRAGVVAYSLAE